MEEMRELGWEDEISSESNEYPILPEGDYDFTITKFERTRYTPSATSTIPACNMAKVTFTVWGAEDKAEITDNFHLHQKMEWKLSSLFLSVGLKKHGEPTRMAWDKIMGKTGRCHVYVDTFKKKDGTEGKSNKIKKLYAYDDEVTTVSPKNNTVPAQTQPTNGWTPGSF